MSWLAFAASLVHSLAWPAAVVTGVITLRRPIAVTLNRGVRRLKAGPVELEFDQELAEAREELSKSPELAEAPTPGNSQSGELSRLAEISPVAAVLGAFSRIEERLAELLDQSDMPARDRRRAGGRSMAWEAHRGGLISDETRAAIASLADLRNLAAIRPRDEIGVERAQEYVALADAVLLALRQRAGNAGR